MKLKYKHIEASRELRLWVTQLVIPIVTVAMMVPESRGWIFDRCKRVKDIMAKRKREKVKKDKELYEWQQQRKSR